MHAIVRTYNGAGAVELMDMLETHQDEVERIIRAVPGLVSYGIMRTGIGGVTVTVCESKEGTDASLAAAKAWLAENAQHLRLDPPVVSEGPVMMRVTA